MNRITTGASTSPTTPTILPGLGAAVSEPLPNRVLTGPVTVRGPLVDDRDRRRFAGIVAREEPAADERDAHGREVAGHRGGHHDNRHILRPWLRLPEQQQPAPVDGIARRQFLGRRRRAHPGNEPAPSTTRSKKATCRSGVAYCAGDSATRIVSTPAASYPGDFESTPRKLRSISPPSTRRTTVTASCPATKTARNRCCVVPASTFGLPFSVAFTSCFQASHAGTTPQRTPVSSATRKLKTRTGPPRCARSAPAPPTGTRRGGACPTTRARSR